jgi:hypothetical protein
MTEVIQLPLDWSLFKDNDGKSFESELSREINSKHPLYGHKTKVIARRGSKDDFLFYLPHTKQYAFVHMTWEMETDGKKPITKIYDTIEAFIADCDDH